MDVIAGSSVEVSGFSNCVSCERGYTAVSAPRCWLIGTGRFLIMGARYFVDAFVNAEGLIRGDGAEFVSGQMSVYPAANAGAGTARKDRDVTAVCSLKK